MYRFAHYTEQDQSKVIAFMKENPFVMITGIGEQYPVATHVPLNIELKEDARQDGSVGRGKVILSGHMMKKTDHHLAFVKNENVLVVFNGPHTFVSASWYSNPAVGSTWDYMVVHAKGKIKFADEEGTYNAVKATSDKYEGKDTIASFNKLPEEYIQQMVKAIVGFTIEVDILDNVFKLSQNRDKDSQLNIIEQLKKRGDDNSRMIAEEIERRLV
jgi:transcriptional regulator